MHKKDYIEMPHMICMTGFIIKITKYSFVHRTMKIISIFHSKFLRSLVKTVDSVHDVIVTADDD